jgi:hypothetical protein
LAEAGSSEEQLRLLKERQSQFAEGSDEWKAYQDQIDGVMERQEQEAEQREDAQWNYNYSLADTATKLDMLKDKLAGVEEGSVEYYRILGQINQVEQQLEREREAAAKKAAGAGGAGGPPKIEPPGKPETEGDDDDGGADERDAQRLIDMQKAFYQAKIRSTAREIGDAIKSLWPRILSGEMMAAIAEGFGKAATAIVIEGNKLLGFFLQAIATGWGPVMTFFGNNLAGLVRGIGAAAPGFITAFLSIFTTIQQFIVGQGPGMLATFLMAVIFPFVNEIIAALPGIVGAFSQWIAATWEWMYAALPGLTAGLMNIISLIQNWVIQQVPVLATMLGEWAVAFVMWLPEAISQLMAGLLGMLGVIITWVVNNAPMILSTLLTWSAAFTQWLTGTAIPALFTALGTLLSNMLNWIVTNGPGILAQLGQWARQFAQWALDAAPGMGLALGQLLGGIMDFITTGAPGILEKLVEWGTQFVQWVVDSTPGMLVALADMLTALAGWVTTVAPEVASFATQIGTALVDGIREGIGNSWGKFLQWIRSKVMELPEPVRTALGISSPSTVMADITEDIPPGMQMGVERTLPKLLRYMGGVANQVSAQAQGIADDVAGAGMGANIADAFTQGRQAAIEGVGAGIAPVPAAVAPKGDTFIIEIRDNQIANDIDLQQISYHVARQIQQHRSRG